MAEYLVKRLQQYAIPNCAIDSFYFDAKLPAFLLAEPRWMYNVTGTLPGEGFPDSTLIIGAHLDASTMKY